MKYNSINLITDQELKAGEMVSLATRKKIRKTVIITHVAVVLLPFLVLMIYQWFKPTPPERIKVRLVQMPLADNSGERSMAPRPQVEKPKTKQKKTVKKKVKPKKKLVKKAKPKPKKKLVKKTKPKAKPKKRITKKTKPKPKSKPKRKILSANDIKISREVVKNRTRKKLSSADLEKKILKNWKKVNYSANPSTRYNGKVTAAYSDTVGLYLEPIWEQPDKTSLAGRFPEVTIRLDIDGRGRVTRARIVRRSGISVMDSSITKLLRKLKRVPPPPGGKAKSVTIIMAIEKS